MTIILRNPIMLLLISPSLGAGPYDQLRTPEGGSPSDSLDFSQSTRSGAEVTITSIRKPKVITSNTGAFEPDTFCNLKWRSTAKIPGMHFLVYLDRAQGAFTHFNAHSEPGLGIRRLIINDDMGKLIVKAEAYDEGSESYGIPGIEVEGEERSRAEEALSQGGPFSPLAHLKGKTVGPLITSIDWKADSEQLKCDKIFHFIANHPPGGYPKGDLRWLFDFVEANTERIQGIIEGWEPTKKKRDSEKKRSLLKKFRQRFSRK